MSDLSLSPLFGAAADPVAAGVRLRELADDPHSDGNILLAELLAASGLLSQSDPAVLGGLLRLIHLVVVRSGPAAIEQLDPLIINGVLGQLPESTPNQYLLLHLLALQRSEPALITLVELLQTHPPQDWIQAGQILSPLMQHDDWPVEAVFPNILATLAQPALAASVMDLANYMFRRGRVDDHPAREYLATLHHILSEVTGRLGQFEEDPRSFGTDVELVQNRLGEAVALAISVCDSLGLIGDESSLGKLNQTVELRHRRVQSEAAGALARLGDPVGKQRLLELTADPAARLRAIAYCDELGMGDDVDESYRSDVATAEAEMSLWLTQPQQMGVPPTSVEVIESRRMLWPSFEDPIDVHLVHFQYNFGDRQYSNVGVTGPVTFALSADVADLPEDDIYAIYAGWHAEHEEIFAVPADQLNAAQQRVMEPFWSHLDRAGYESIQAALLGFFLDERAGVFRAIRGGTECLVVTDGLETIDQPIAGRLRPLGSVDLFNLYKGRKMLRTFNP